MDKVCWYIDDEIHVQAKLMQYDINVHAMLLDAAFSGFLSYSDSILEELRTVL